METREASRDRKRRERARDRLLTGWVPKWKACKHWNGKTRRIVCDDCRAARLKSRSAEWYKHHPSYYVPKGPREPFLKACADCGLVCEVRTHTWRRCSACAGKRTREQYKARGRKLSRRTRFLCVDCGMAIPDRANERGKGPHALRCPPCQRIHRRKLARPRQSQRDAKIRSDRFVNRPLKITPVWSTTLASIPGHLPRPDPKPVVPFNVLVSHEYILDRDRWICGICGKKIKRQLKHPSPLSASIDHIIPLARGGSHIPDNLQASHLRCNITKRTKDGAQLLLFG